MVQGSIASQLLCIVGNYINTKRSSKSGIPPHTFNDEFCAPVFPLLIKKDFKKREENRQDGCTDIFFIEASSS